MGGIFQYSTRLIAETEALFTSVERITHFSRNLPTEAAHIVDSCSARLAQNKWPATGCIEVRDLVVRYRPGLEPALNGVTFSVAAGAKVGIVGRTGSGKSTLALALFRILERVEGLITIDGEDIANLGLRQLRSRLAIIPQDPVLFQGTLMSNLDPFRQHDDAAIWKALEQVREPLIAPMSDQQ